MIGAIKRMLAPRTKLENPKKRTWFFTPRTQAGILVDEDRALNYSAVWACVRVITESISALPWCHMRRSSQRHREKLYGSAVHRLLNLRASPETDAVVWRETILAHALIWGNGYAEIERNMVGTPVALWILPPHRVKPERDESDRLVYRVINEQSDDVFLLPESVFHLKGLGNDGLTGYSVVQRAAQSIGLGMACEIYGAGFFGNGSIPGGVLEHPESLSETAKQNIIRSWNKKHGGPGGGSNLQVLEEGLKYHQIGIPPEDAQFLETRKFQVNDIARWFRVPPHKIGDLERGTFSNIEHQSIEFATDTLAPWTRRLEIEADIKLLRSQPDVCTKINMNGLLRGDATSRFDAYNTAIQSGIMSPNDVRELEDMNPIPDGNVYMVNGNMIALEQVKNPPEPVAPPMLPEPEPDDEEDDEDNDLRRYIVGDVLSRAVKREQHRVEAGEADEAFYAQHQEYIAAQLSVASRGMGYQPNGEMTEWMLSYRGRLMDEDIDQMITDILERLENDNTGKD